MLKYRQAPGPVIDVRSPVEFLRGHIPGAVSLPIFSDEERAAIGTCYKKQGREEAIRLGFELAGPRLGSYLQKVHGIAEENAVRIHCWRGGMRSRSIAWFLAKEGHRVVTLKGGYKSYRKWVRKQFGTNWRLLVVTGLTGTGKTKILNALEEMGEQVLDLEGLANHRGSSFGGIGMLPQPTTQQFENLIAEKLAGFDVRRPVWIESESGRVGRCWVPEELYRSMKSAAAIQIIRPVEERLDLLTDMYSQRNSAELIAATKRIRKRLGGERTRRALELMNEKRFREACRIILDYYDRAYREDLARRPVGPLELEVGGLSVSDAAGLLIKHAYAARFAIA